MNKKIISKEIEFAGKKLSLETGQLATLTNMSVKAQFGDTVLLVTVVSGGYNPEIDFFPLTINYQEKFYASGTVKSSRFQKRDGRATDEAIITGRMIDHAIRPLFPSDFMDEVQVIVTILSLDNESDPEFLSMIATSAALHASNVPWSGPMSTLRVGYANEDYVTCPSRDVLLNSSDLDLMVSFAGEDKKFLAIEAEANILSEAKILGAIEYARDNVTPLIDLIRDFSDEVNPTHEKYTYTSAALSQEVKDAVNAIANERVVDLFALGEDKDVMQEKLDEVSAEVHKILEGKFKKIEIAAAFQEIKKDALQTQVLEKHKRVDGRAIDEIRELSSEVGILPRVHGSGLFSRGITQILTTATLAAPSSELLIEDMYGEVAKRFIHYYNFPPYSNGETGRVGFPKNREIGHGMIAENALRPVIPDQKDFPYMILLVSETMSSSGSTSMASTCGSTLALMDAGVPIKDMVAGIGVGLIANRDFSKTLIMTDVAYLEDALGLLDFKMTGTKTGVTAIQCDMKVPGLPMDLVPKIIEQSTAARLKVLEHMEKTISAPRTEVSKYAPKTVTINIDPDKIGLIIGSGGKTIKEIQTKSGAEVSIEDDGTIICSSDDPTKAQKAADIISGMLKEVKPGEIYDGIVEDVVDFGAFVEILPGKTGLLHISEISNEYVEDVNSVIKIGDAVKVKVLEVSRDGKMSLSIKALNSNAPVGGEGGYRSNRRDRPDRNGGRSRDRDNRRPNRRY